MELSKNFFTYLTGCFFLKGNIERESPAVQLYYLKRELNNCTSLERPEKERRKNTMTGSPPNIEG
jgi:hypothetical protein